MGDIQKLDVNGFLRGGDIGGRTKGGEEGWSWGEKEVLNEKDWMELIV